jgi:hypothetical protein
MTRTGPSKPVNEGFAQGRLDNARAFLEAAEVAATLAGPGDNANPIVSHVVNSVIAYTDALTARFGGRVNQKDHDAAVKALRDALGNSLPRAQEARLTRILKQKDEAQYGARRGRLTRALELLEDLRAYAQWAETAMQQG